MRRYSRWTDNRARSLSASRQQGPWRNSHNAASGTEGDEAEKLATIADIRSQVNPQDAGFDAPPLSDEEAMELFEKTCEPANAQGFRLYILYARGAAFTPLVREP